MDLDKVSPHYKDQALNVLLFYMDQDTRRRLMTEVPMAYNALFRGWTGDNSDTVKTVLVATGETITSPGPK